MAWCLVRYRDNFFFFFTLLCSTVLHCWKWKGFEVPVGQVVGCLGKEKKNIINAVYGNDTVMDSGTGNCYVCGRRGLELSL
jgi:hypothetical protein